MDFSSVIARVSPSIAKLYCFNADGKIANTGTGFIYAKKGVLVTCKHVIQGYDPIVCKFPGDTEDTFHTTKLAVTDDEHDLALLRVSVDQPPLLPASAKSNGATRPGIPVIFSGYPLNLEALTTHQGILSAITKDAVGVTTYLIDGTVNSGNSGCPLMNENGEILGVVNLKRRERADLLSKVEGMTVGAMSIHGVDLVEIYQALISNVQLGIGYAVPAAYIPAHKDEEQSAKSPAPKPAPSRRGK